MTAKHLLVGLILTLALAGCSRSVVPSPIETPAPTPLTSPPAASTVTITYQRSGGLVGSNDTWIIDPQGKVTHQGSGTSTQLTEAQMAGLSDAVRAADFMALEDSYVPKDTCCDRYEYTITIVANSQPKTVRTLDSSPTAPPALTQLVAALNRLVPAPGPGSQ